ncbi:MAG: non-ribosomal peptide synthetase [Candidatus Sericytochromatia bacterium]
MTDLLHSLWQNMAAHPSAPALLAPDFCLSYAELGQAVQGLAQIWQQAGVRPGERIGLLAVHSPEYVIGLLACWYSGAVAVPLDASAPARLDDLQARTRLRWVLDSRWSRAHSWVRAGQALSPPPAPHLPQPGEPAYLLFSSGSSGRAKGVLVPHDGLLGVLQAQIAALNLRPGQRCLWVLSPAFDASLSDLGTALLAGATLVLDPDPLRDLQHLQALLHRWHIGYVDLPPALLSWLRPEDCPRSLETILIGGESPPAAAVRRWAEKVRLINVYGPTEATICTSLLRCGPDWQQPLLGTPLPGVRYRVVDVQGQEAETGELWIQAPGLALGYWEDPALTAARFVTQPDGRWYRSGDRVERLADGQLCFRGRLDRQLKHNGRLLCPEESEAVLHAHPAIARAAVVPHRSGPLVAWLELHADLPTVPADLEAHLNAHLPRGLQPQRWAVLSQLPLTPSGKVDLQHLQNAPLPHPGPDPGAPFLLSTTEAHLARIWANLLQPPFAALAHPDADFFALGGSSLQVLACVALAAEAGLRLSPEILYQGRTLAQTAALLEAGTDQTLTAQDLRQRVQDLPQGPFPSSPPAGRSLMAAGAEVLLTGATGFLGSRLLAELLQAPGPQLHCLVRAATPAAGYQRLVAALAPWGVPLDKERVQIWCGDLSAPRLGLSNAAWHRLETRLTAVLHCAAQVDLARDLDSLWRANVAALPTLARLGCPLHHLSSLSVLVGAHPLPPVARENDHLQLTAWVAGGYAQSKWAAEAWLLAQAGPHWIYRPGLVSGDSQSGWAPTRDWLRALIHGLLQIEALPELPAPEANSPEWELDLTPVDHVARALLLLSAEAPGIYHLAHSTALSLRRLLTSLETRYTLPRLSRADWQHRARQQLQRSPNLASSAALLALSRALETPGKGPNGQRHWHSLNLFQATGIRLSSPVTQAKLARAGLSCPPPETLLLRYLTFWESEGLPHVVSI